MTIEQMYDIKEITEEAYRKSEEKYEILTEDGELEDEDIMARMYLENQKDSKLYKKFLIFKAYEIISKITAGITLFLILVSILYLIANNWNQPEQIAHIFKTIIFLPSLLVVFFVIINMPMRLFFKNILCEAAEEMPEPEHKQTIYRIHFSLPSSSSRSALTIAGTLVDNGIQFPESEIEQNIILEMKESDCGLIQFDETGFSICCRKI